MARWGVNSWGYKYGTKKAEIRDSVTVEAQNKKEALKKALTGDIISSIKREIEAHGAGFTVFKKSLNKFIEDGKI